MPRESARQKAERLIKELERETAKFGSDMWLRKYAYDVDPYDGIEIPYTESENAAIVNCHSIVVGLTELGEPAVGALRDAYTYGSSHMKRYVVDAVGGIYRKGNLEARKLLEDIASTASDETLRKQAEQYLG